MNSEVVGEDYPQWANCLLPETVIEIHATRYRGPYYIDMPHLMLAQ